MLDTSVQGESIPRRNLGSYTWRSCSWSFGGMNFTGSDSSKLAIVSPRYPYPRSPSRMLIEWCDLAVSGSILVHNDPCSFRNRSPLISSPNVTEPLESLNSLRRSSLLMIVPFVMIKNEGCWLRVRGLCILTPPALCRHTKGVPFFCYAAPLAAITLRWHSQTLFRHCHASATQLRGCSQ